MIVAFTAKKARKVRGTDIKAGDTLYAIRKNGMYFIWCYIDAEFAKKIDEKATPGNATDISANWRHSLDELVPSGLANLKG